MNYPEGTANTDFAKNDQDWKLKFTGPISVQGINAERILGKCMPSMK